MKALYVTVAITLILVLAGFNHAHGFTTFGKTPTNPQTPPPPPIVPAKLCGNHTDCWSIPQTSCVQEPNTPDRKGCLCGDNKTPVNGQCHAEHKAPNHICSKDNECVEDATCQLMVTGAGTAHDNTKVCKCEEGHLSGFYSCNGGERFISSSLPLMLFVISRTVF